MNIRVLTFGWDFPPLKNGGLGVACHGLTTELCQQGIEVIFVLPRTQEIDFPARFIFADIGRSKIRTIDSPIQPYKSSHAPLFETLPDGTRRVYSHNIIAEVYRYAQKAAEIAEEEDFDIIHAHDWVSYLAGLAAKEVSGKPLILHVHATSFDQSGGRGVDPEVYHIEKKAFDRADGIITVSNYTKHLIMEKHGADPGKIAVVHNGTDGQLMPFLAPVLTELKREGKKIVLYHGRITIQKGPDYFVRAARRVVDVDPNVIFVISGWGDMQQQIMHMVGSLGLSKHVIFAGSLWDEERDRMYQAADLVVMPSVSEPFGLVPLESLKNGTPVLISKQSGAAEVLTHALKVDFWDVEEMANKIIAALRYDPLNRQLAAYGRDELGRLSWRAAAEKVRSFYYRILEWVRHSAKK